MINIYECPTASPVNLKVIDPCLLTGHTSCQVQPKLTHEPWSLIVGRSYMKNTTPRVFKRSIPKISTGVKYAT